MKAVWLATFCCAFAHAQDNSADRVVPASPAPRENFAVKLLRPLEPERYSPLSGKSRFSEYFDNTFGAYFIFRAAASAAVSQAMNSPHEWGGGMKGYAERFGNDVAVNVVHNSISYGLSAVFHEDNRYFASGKRTRFRRAIHAALSPFEARNDDGTVGFSFSNAAGTVGASLISRTWAPPSWQGGENIGRSIAFSFAGQAAFNAFREFLPDMLHHRR